MGAAADKNILLGVEVHAVLLKRKKSSIMNAGRKFNSHILVSYQDLR